MEHVEHLLDHVVHGGRLPGPQVQDPAPRGGLDRQLPEEPGGVGDVGEVTHWPAVPQTELDAL